MATVTFSSVTIWNDALTGRGRVLPSVTEPTRVRSYVRPVRSVGLIAKDIGLDAGAVQMTLEYNLTSTQLNTLRSALAGLRGSVGTLTTPPGQSYSNCVLEGITTIRQQPVLPGGGGSIHYRVAIHLEFIRLRA